MNEDKCGFLERSQEEEALVCLLDQRGGVCGPGHVLGDVDPRELEG